MTSPIKVKKGKNGLSTKQALFVAEYLVDFNGTKAAIRAGYAAKNADAEASRLLRNAKISALVDAAKKRQLSRLEISADRVVQEYGRLAFVNPQDFVTVKRNGGAAFDLRGLNADHFAAVSEITVDEQGKTKIRFHSKTTALRDLAEHMGVLSPLPIGPVATPPQAVLEAREIAVSLAEQWVKEKYARLHAPPTIDVTPKTPGPLVTMTPVKKPNGNGSGNGHG